MKKILAIILVLVLAVSLVAGCGNGATSSNGGDESTAKNLRLRVVHKDESIVDYITATDAEFVGDAFDETVFSGEEGEYGLYVTTVDGEEVNADNEEWWCLTKDGEAVTTGLDSTPFKDGDVFELTFTTGY